MSKERNTQQESAIGRSWEEFEKDIYTADEIRESDLRVSLISEFMKYYLIILIQTNYSILIYELVNLFDFI